MKSLIEIFIVVYLFITNALAVENFKKKVTNILEDYENTGKNSDRLSKKDSEFFTLTEKRRKRSSAKNKLLSLSSEIMPIESTPEIPEVPLVDEKKKLYDDFNKGFNMQPTPNLNYITNQNYNNNNNNLNMIGNSNVKNINNNNNFIPLSSYDNSYHRSQYFSNSNDYSIRSKNEDLEKKYASYRKPEYIHTDYRTVSNFPNDDSLNEVFDDPVFLEGKLDDQNKLKVKVPVKVADRFDKINFPEENKNETTSSQEIMFNSNQINFNSNYKYSKAKIINEKESDNTNNNAATEGIDSTRKKFEKKIKVTEKAKKIINSSDTKHIAAKASEVIINKPVIKFNKTQNESLNELKILNDKRNLEKGVIYRNITIHGEKDLKVLEQDMKILKFDFLNYLNVTDYLRIKKLLTLNLNLNFDNNRSEIDSTHFNQTSTQSKNNSIIHSHNNTNISLTNKTHLETKIKDFIKEKIINKTLNVSNIKNISKKEIKNIVSGFKAKAKEEKKKFNQTNSINNCKNKTSFNRSITVENKGLYKMKKTAKNLNSTELLYKNLDKVSERLTMMFKKVLKDIVLNPADYILEDKLENNLFFMKEEIRNSLSESIEIPTNIETNKVHKIENNNQSEIVKKINQIANSNKLSKAKKSVVEAIKNLTSAAVNKSSEINFIQTKSIGTALKKNNLNESNLKNVSDIHNKEIHNLINKKIENNNKIDFILKKSYSKKIAVELRTNHPNSTESNSKVSHKATELDHKIKKHIKDNFPEVKKPVQKDKKIKLNNKTRQEQPTTHVMSVNNLTKDENKKQEKVKIYEKFESQKNFTSEKEKKIVSQLPKINQIIKDRKLIDSKDKDNSKKINNSSMIIKKINSTLRPNRKDLVNKTITVLNKTHSKRNHTNASKPETKNFTNQKVDSTSGNLRKDHQEQEIKNTITKNSLSNNSKDDQNNKIVDSIFKQDLNNLHTKTIPIKKVEQKNDEMEIDDGSVMAEILKAYKNKLKTRRF